MGIAARRPSIARHSDTAASGERLIFSETVVAYEMEAALALAPWEYLNKQFNPDNFPDIFTPIWVASRSCWSDRRPVQRAQPTAAPA
jgi:hypothetical protein